MQRRQWYPHRPMFSRLHFQEATETTLTGLASWNASKTPFYSSNRRFCINQDRAWRKRKKEIESFWGEEDGDYKCWPLKVNTPPPPKSVCLFIIPSVLSHSSLAPLLAPMERCQPKRDFLRTGYLLISQHLVNTWLNCSERSRVSFVGGSMRT